MRQLWRMLLCLHIASSAAALASLPSPTSQRGVVEGQKGSRNAVTMVGWLLSVGSALGQQDPEPEQAECSF